jgi:hypothetical protein
MSTIAQMALKNIQEQKARKARASNSTDSAVVIVGARQRVVSKVLGEITRRKTEDKTIVELYSGEDKIGFAQAVYKTATQRKWSVNLNGAMIHDQHTINKGIRALLEVIDAETVKPKAKAKATQKKDRSAKVVLEAQ